MTTVYVTHDQVEAMTLGQRVAVLRDGVLQQVDTPQMLFRQPREPVRRGVHRLSVDESRRSRGRRRRSPLRGHELPRPGRGGVRDGRVIVGIRPTDFADAASRPTRRFPRLTVRAEVVEDLGSETHVIFPVDAPRVIAEAVRAAVEDARTTTERSSRTTSARCSPPASTGSVRSCRARRRARGRHAPACTSSTR